jgi:hypothetical protein
MQMEVHPSLLIKVFTARVAKKIGLPVERFRLTYGKWKFTDLWQIGDYNIQEGTFIEIHVKFSGGGKDNNDKGNNDKVNTPIQLPSCPVSCPVFLNGRESPLATEQTASAITRFANTRARGFIQRLKQVA